MSKCIISVKKNLLFFTFVVWKRIHFANQIKEKRSDRLLFILKNIKAKKNWRQTWVNNVFNAMSSIIHIINENYFSINKILIDSTHFWRTTKLKYIINSFRFLFRMCFLFNFVFFPTSNHIIFIVISCSLESNCKAEIFLRSRQVNPCRILNWEIKPLIFESLMNF